MIKSILTNWKFKLSFGLVGALLMIFGIASHSPWLFGIGLMMFLIAIWEEVLFHIVSGFLRS